MGEFWNGLIGNLIASLTMLIAVRVMVKNDREKEIQDRILHAEKHTVIEQTLGQHDIDIAEIKLDIKTEFKRNRGHSEKRFGELTQLIMQLTRENNNGSK